MEGGGGGESSWIVRHGNQINLVGYVQIVGISCYRCGAYRLDRYGGLEPRERVIKHLSLFLVGGVGKRIHCY